MTLVAGVPLDRYVLLRELAGGGMASIFLARRSGSGGFRRLLAIKRLKPELVEDAQLRDSFLEEARLSALLRHPNIIQMYDLLEVDGIPAIVMEYVHGRIA
ncbi:MAG: hypothetical protein FJ125_08085, partial [Deltaproteobacteria bacterium]|nr:hypothetical protein [Deltaproteobacteria bacterium]